MITPFCNLPRAWERKARVSRRKSFQYSALIPDTTIWKNRKLHTKLERQELSGHVSRSKVSKIWEKIWDQLEVTCWSRTKCLKILFHNSSRLTKKTSLLTSLNPRRRRKTLRGSWKKMFRLSGVGTRNWPSGLRDSGDTLCTTSKILTKIQNISSKTHNQHSEERMVTPRYDLLFQRHEKMSCHWLKNWTKKSKSYQIICQLWKNLVSRTKK